MHVSLSVVYILNTKYIINMRLKESSFLNILKFSLLFYHSYFLPKDSNPLQLNTMFKLQTLCPPSWMFWAGQKTISGTKNDIRDKKRYQGQKTISGWHLRNIKHFPCWYTVISTRVEIGKTRNCVETRRPKGGVFSHNFEFFQFSRVLI